MQTSRKCRVIIEPPAAHARQEAANSGIQYTHAKVMSLGDYVGRLGRTKLHQLVPYARTNEGDIPASRRDPLGDPVSPGRNAILAALPAETYAELERHLEAVSLERGRVTCPAQREQEYVYFPTDGIVSLLCELENGNSVEVAITGNDGVAGVPAFLGGGTAISREVVRHAGHGFRIPADTLKVHFERCPHLRQSLLRFAQTLMVQMTQAAACSRQHRLEQQLARLLLSTLDRLQTNELALTQDALANLLGTRRESITAAAGRLQESGSIRYFRGRIEVLSRPDLEARACECYAIVKRELRRLSPTPGEIAQPSPATMREFHEFRRDKDAKSPWAR